MTEIIEHHVEIDLYEVIALWIIGYNYDEPHPPVEELARVLRRDMRQEDEPPRLLHAAGAVTRHICDKFLDSQTGAQIRTISRPGHA
jgi:hypothetical protein